MNTSLQSHSGLHTDTAGRQLPMGWERHETIYGVAYYIDQFTETTTWESPVQTTSQKQSVATNANGDQEDLMPLLGSKQRASAEKFHSEKDTEVMRSSERVASEKESRSFMGKSKRASEKGEEKKRRATKKDEMVYVENLGWLPKGKMNYLVNHM